MVDPAIGQRATLTYPNGLIATTISDPLGRLTSLEQEYNSTLLASYAYTFDALGNRRSLTELGGATTTWDYDAGSRLTRELRRTSGGTPVWDLRFTYDDAGNRQEMREVVSNFLTTYAYVPDGLDQLASVTTNGTTRTYTYDARGNLTSDGVATYTYDTWDQLIGRSATGDNRTYVYDVLGNRIRQTVNSVATEHLWDEWSRYGDVLAEIDGSGAVAANYAVADTILLEQERGGSTSYQLPDAQGNTRILFDADTDTVAEQYQYDAFGGLRSGPSTPATSYLYTGQQSDTGSGLYYLRARYYNPADGRFLSRDTYPVDIQNPAQLNRYAYGANNPVNGFDPTGQLFIEQVTTDKMNEEQRKAHERFHAGTDWARGQDSVALSLESIFSALFDEAFVKALWQLFLTAEAQVGLGKNGKYSLAGSITLALGTVYHLGASTNGKPGTIIKAASINADRGTCQWSKVARQTGCDRVPSYAAFLRDAVVAGLKATLQVLYPGSTAIGLKGVKDGNNYADGIVPWKKGDAEILIARWAIRNYGGPPTPHRMLDIATSRPACDYFDTDGSFPCELILPLLKGIQPFLFESTIYKP